MLAVLALEIIGDNYFAYKRDLANGKARENPRVERYAEMMGRDKARPWVARIVGFDKKYGFKREFQRGQRDYSKANSIGSRGVYEYFALKPGIYEVHERLTWKRTRRYFCRVQEAEIIEINREEVEECLLKSAA
jgi:hypothetical protein